MSANEEYFTIDEFHGGIVRDEQSQTAGAALGLEEIDIFDNENYFQAEYTPTSHSIESPSLDGYIVYDFNQYVAEGDNLHTIGALTSGTEAMIGNFDDEGTGFAELQDETSMAISSDNTPRPFDESEAFITSETTNQGGTGIGRRPSNWVYFTTGDVGTAPFLRRYSDYENNIELVAELDQDDLPEFDLPTLIRLIYGELYICYANSINRVAGDGTFTYDDSTNPITNLVTLPKEWYIVDVTTLGRDSRSMLALCRPANASLNKSRAFWIDLATGEVDDYLDIPFGGAQWVNNIGADVLMAFVEDGRFRVRKLSQPYPGSISTTVPNIDLRNVRDRAEVFSNSDIDDLKIDPSPARAVHNQYGYLYFPLNKTDKPGIYRIGKLDQGDDYAISMAHKLPGNYPDQLITSMAVYDEKKIIGYLDNYTGTDTGTGEVKVVEPNDASATRAATAVYESVWTGVGDALSDKQVKSVHIITHPLPASTQVKVFVAKDYDDSYTEIFRKDGSTMNGTGDTVGVFQPTGLTGANVFRVKIELISSGTDTPKVTTIGYKVVSENNPSNQ